ncbi:MAG: HAD family hydrolase [Clostridia bacterium]|nr:HAD family hydrolase [Clostridia bacterium]
MALPHQPLLDFTKTHDRLICIDSDGCAFDSMEIKHKECFIPNIIRCWDLQYVSKYVREAAEFVNLYSKWRGINRFPALIRVFDLLSERGEALRRGYRSPETGALRAWMERETKLGDPALEAEVARTADPVLVRTLRWSKAVNAAVGETVRGVPPFPYVRESLIRLQDVADIVVCSATPGEALIREWNEHGLAGCVKVIAGQEMGSKKEIIRHAMTGRYDAEHVLMLGDAPGDKAAADANRAAFYPINPGSEEASWQRFLEEGLDRFLAGTYAGAYETRLHDAFDACLPDHPPWTAVH